MEFREELTQQLKEMVKIISEMAFKDSDRADVYFSICREITKSIQSELEPHGKNDDSVPEDVCEEINSMTVSPTEQESEENTAETVPDVPDEPIEPVTDVEVEGTSTEELEEDPQSSRDKSTTNSKNKNQEPVEPMDSDTDTDMDGIDDLDIGHVKAVLNRGNFSLALEMVKDWRLGTDSNRAACGLYEVQTMFSEPSQYFARTDFSRFIRAIVDDEKPNDTRYMTRKKFTKAVMMMTIVNCSKVFKEMNADPNSCPDGVFSISDLFKLCIPLFDDKTLGLDVVYKVLRRFLNHANVSKKYVSWALDILQDVGIFLHPLFTEWAFSVLMKFAYDPVELATWKKKIQDVWESDDSRTSAETGVYLQVEAVLMKSRVEPLTVLSNSISEVVRNVTETQAIAAINAFCDHDCKNSNALFVEVVNNLKSSQSSNGVFFKYATKRLSERLEYFVSKPVFGSDVDKINNLMSRTLCGLRLVLRLCDANIVCKDTVRWAVEKVVGYPDRISEKIGLRALQEAEYLLEPEFFDTMINWLSQYPDISFREELARIMKERAKKKNK